MANSLNLKNYHHLVIVAQDAAEAVRLWAKVFGFDAPVLNDVGPVFKAWNDPAYPSLLRRKRWDSDFKQAVFNQHHFFFEIDEPGTQDNFAEFVAKHGNGVAYIGLLAGEKRDGFLRLLENTYGCETVLEQYFPGGDWSVSYVEKALGIDLCVKKLPGGDHTDHPVLPDFVGLTIVVDDLDEKLRNWKDILEVRDILRAEHAAEIRDGVFPITLIEAGHQDVFDDYYRVHGSGVFQITIPAEGAFREQVENALSADGFSELTRYEAFGKRYVVYDTVGRMGVNIALV